MSTGIKPKIVGTTKTFSEQAKRYIFYPLSNLDFAASQFISPIWSPKIPRGRIVLLEACEYITQVANEGEQLAGANGVTIGERTMGTDAQVKFLMGNTDGTGFMDKGMTHLESLTDVDPMTAAEVEALIIPNDGKGNFSVPENMVKFDFHLATLSIKGEDPVSELAKKVQREMLEGVRRGIQWCKSYTNQLEMELRDGQNGGAGLKYLSEVHKFYFQTIEKPLPEDRQGTNMGNEIAKALSSFVGNLPQQSEGKSSNIGDTIELEELRRKLAEANKTIEEQEEVISSITAEE